MNVILFIPHYIHWHYTRAWKDLYQNISNILNAIGSFFSFSSLLKTLFLPWKRLGEEYEKGFDPENLLSTFILNTLMRALGFLIRGAVLIFGMSIMLLSSILGIFVFALWVLLPFLILFFFALSISSLFS